MEVIYDHEVVEEQVKTRPHSTDVRIKIHILSAPFNHSLETISEMVLKRALIKMYTFTPPLFWLSELQLTCYNFWHSNSHITKQLSDLKDCESQQI